MSWTLRSVLRRPLARVVLLCLAIGTIASCDDADRTRSFFPTSPHRIQQPSDSDTTWATCVDMDENHCPLFVPTGIQDSAIENGIFDTQCSWMGQYLMNMYLRGNINMYSGFRDPPGYETIADSHWDSTQPPGSLGNRIHVRSSDNYAYIHSVIRHEAAHAYFPNDTSEARMDSIANACGPDQKPY